MCAITLQRSLKVERMGRVPYGPMLALQEDRHQQVREGTAEDTLFLLEHDPVITLGKNTKDGNLLVSEEFLTQRGFELFRTGRGGDITYHGPGQIVGYPIVKLQEEERDIKRYVGYLEEVLIRTAYDFGIKAHRVDGLRGIWVGNEKLAAIGVRIAEWTTMHGFAINVSTNLDDFRMIIPCGLHGRGVTSMERLLGTPVALSEVEDRLVFHASQMLDRETRVVEPTPLPNIDPVATVPPAEAHP